MDALILNEFPLGFPWKTLDPFLFCVHHDDRYPAGNEALGPNASLVGRDLGNDFAGLDGWRMYHGETVPGFPPHPHRGFETVTVVRKGFIDHSDSLGATARFGAGDTQWLTAGKGIQHSEMFPLLNPDAGNPMELFQIWLNLPARGKMSEPYFTMFWEKDTPRRDFTDDQGRHTQVTVVAGRLGETNPPPPPPDSWASQPASHLAIWTLRMEAGARWILPKSETGVNRVLYFFQGESLQLGVAQPLGAAQPGVTDAGPGAAMGESRIKPGRGVQLRPDSDALLVNGGAAAELLLLQGRPIGEPVVQYGPFVMNTRDEIEQAYADYQRTRFGGWPWPGQEPVHPKSEGRFAKYPDGRVERPNQA